MTTVIRINYILAGHVASDSLGMNLFLDKLPSSLDIIACGGFNRARRIY